MWGQSLLMVTSTSSCHSIPHSHAFLSVTVGYLIRAYKQSVFLLALWQVCELQQYSPRPCPPLSLCWGPLAVTIELGLSLQLWLYFLPKWGESASSLLCAPLCHAQCLVFHEAPPEPRASCGPATNFHTPLVLTWSMSLCR